MRCNERDMAVKEVSKEECAVCGSARFAEYGEAGRFV